jgi:alanyl-tRNA synthetase
MERVNSFWNQINDSTKSINSYLHENSRNFAQTVENNSKIFEESAQSILELRKKEDIEMNKMRKLCEENKKL